MAKQNVDPFEYLVQFNKLLAQPGALLAVADRNGTANVMTIGWAHIGIVWGKAVCLVYVRPSRHSYTCLEQHRQFTVNTAPATLARAVELCGTVSGRDRDKFQAAQLTAVPGKEVKVPVIEECILHYECKVLHYNDLLSMNLQRDVINEYYPQDDFHRVYFGEICACYGDRDELGKV